MRINLNLLISCTLEKIKKANGMDLKQIRTEDPINEKNLIDIEKFLNFNFPEVLRYFYLKEYSLFEMFWVADEEIFGIDCTMGELYIISPDLVLEYFQDMQYEVEQSLSTLQSSGVDNGLKAIVDDWPYWIPVIRFGNGDAFCIDKRSQEVVFLEHDVMDAGPNLHGLKIAKNVEDLFLKWSQIGYVNIYDWYKVTNEEGITLDKSVIKELKLRLK